MPKIIPYQHRLVALAKALRSKMTYGEIALWREIRGKKLGYKFSRQIPIDSYIVDFYCKELKLAIEVDGGIHFTEEQEKYDFHRQKKELESLGISVMHFNDEDVKNNLDVVLDELKEKIKAIRGGK